MNASKRKIFYAQRTTGEEHERAEAGERGAVDQGGEAAHTEEVQAEEKIREVLAGLFIEFPLAQSPSQ